MCVSIIAFVKMPAHKSNGNCIAISFRAIVVPRESTFNGPNERERDHIMIKISE